MFPVEFAFKAMSEESKARLSRSKRDESVRDALSEKEYRGIIAMLRADEGITASQDCAMVPLGVTSRMRAVELVGLRWENITESDDGFKATIRGKGAKRRTIQLEPEAVRSCRRAFRARCDRKPQGSDYVLNALQTGRGNSAGITRSLVHVRLKGDYRTSEGSRDRAGEPARINAHVTAHLRDSTRRLRRSTRRGAAAPGTQQPRNHGDLSAQRSRP